MGGTTSARRVYSGRPRSFPEPGLIAVRGPAFGCRGDCLEHIHLGSYLFQLFSNSQMDGFAV